MCNLYSITTNQAAISALFRVVMRELSSKAHAPGVIPLTEDLQVAVSKKWLQIHSQTFAVPGAEKDKVFFYPKSWDCSSPALERCRPSRVNELVLTPDRAWI